MNANKTNTIFLLALLVIAAPITWLLFDRLVEDDSDSKRGSSDRPIPVEIGTIDRGPIELRRTFTGTLEASAAFVVAPKVGGRIEELTSDLGDRVAWNQVVARLDNAPAPPPAPRPHAAAPDPDAAGTLPLMSIKPDWWIRERAKEGMIEPFVEGQIRDATQGRVISYGTSSYGYDLRCADEFKIFTNINSAIVDPKNFDDDSFVDVKSDVCIIPPNSFALSRTVEYFRVPRSVLTICVGKSTYARCGIIVNVTPFEPEWEGYVTLEISNTTPLPARIYANEGIAQVLFFEGDESCEVSYADKKGKYQKQNGIALPKL